MEQYIPKSALVAEIERLVNNQDSALDYEAALEDVLNIIDSLQEEPVSIWHDGCKNPKSETNVLMIRKDEEDSNYPPIAGCFHGTNFRLDGKNWGYYNGFCYNEIEPPVKWAYIDDILNLSNVERTGKNWKEPVSEELEEASKEWLRPQLDKYYAAYGETKQMELTYFDGYAMLDAIEFGAQWQKENLWKPADGDDLPEIDREVIVLCKNGRVAFGHRPVEKFMARPIGYGRTEEYEVETYDKGGWNVPDIAYWLDIKLPKEIEP